MEDIIAELSREKVDVEDKWEQAIDRFATDPDLAQPSSEPRLAVQALALVARRIVRPTYIWDETPRLLNILVNLEVLRKRIVDDSRLAQEYIQIKQSEGLQEELDQSMPSKYLRWLGVLAAEEADRIRRNEYFAISLDLRWHHLAHLLISRERQTFERLVTLYFPPRERVDLQNKPYLEDLSEQEIEKQAMVREQMLSVGEQEQEWRQAREQWWKSQVPTVTDEVIYGESEFQSYRRDFLHRFPPFTPFNECLSILEKWISGIEDAHRVFSSVVAASRDPNERKKAGVSPKKKKSRASMKEPKGEAS